MDNEQDTKTELFEQIDFSNPTYSFKPNENHQWRQKGCYLVCKSCEIVHATYIGNDSIMVGMDEKGKPILKNKRDYFAH